MRYHWNKRQVLDWGLLMRAYDPMSIVRFTHDVLQHEATEAGVRNRRAIVTVEIVGEVELESPEES